VGGRWRRLPATPMPTSGSGKQSTSIQPSDCTFVGFMAVNAPQHWQAWAWGFSGGSTSGTPSAAHGRTTNNEAEILVLRGRRKPLRAAVRAGTQRRGRTTHPAGRGTGLPTLAA